MRGFIETKAFITRAELSKQNEIYRKEIIEEFDGSSKSSDDKLSDRLLESIKNNFEEIFNENENRRKAFIEKSIEKCGLMFTNLVNEDLKDNRFVESDVFESKFKTYEREVFNEFELSFSGEEKSLFESDYFKLTKFFNNFESGARITNHERIKEFEKTKETYVKNVTDYYEQKMNELLNSHVYISKEMFKHSENIIRTETKDKFRDEYDFKNHIKNEIFDLKVNQKLKESKNRFKDDNIKKCRDVSESSEKIVHKSISTYKQEFNERIHLIKTIEDFESSHKIVHKKAFEVLLTCPIQESPFFDTYFNLFNEEITKLYNDFKTDLIDKSETQNRIYETALQEAHLIYKIGMRTSLEDQKVPTTDVLNRASRIQQRNAVKYFEDKFIETTKQDPLYMKYLFQLKDRISAESDDLIESFEENQRSDERKVEILCKQFKNSFNANINAVIERATNLNELSNLFIKIKRSSKAKMFEDNDITNKSLVNNKLSELDNFMDQRFQEIKIDFEKKKEKKSEEYNRNVIQTKDFYKQIMDNYINNNEYITDDQLSQFHEMLSNQIKSDLSTNLKPEFDINIKPLIDESNRLISDEYQIYMKTIEDNRNKKVNSIKKNCNQFIVEYETRIKSILNSVKSVDELQERHKSILDTVLENSRRTMAESNPDLILIQTNLIENEVSNKFITILNEFDDKIVSIDKMYKKFLELSKNFYVKEMDSHFENRDTYEKVTLDNLLSEHKTDAINKFNEYLEQNSLCFDHLKSVYSKMLIEFIETSNLKYKEKNRENFRHWDDSLSDWTDRVKEKYKQTMESHLNSAKSERDLRLKHSQTMTNLLKEFDVKFSQFDPAKAFVKKDYLREYMDNEMSFMAEKLHGHNERNKNNLREKSDILINEFIKKMNEIIDKDKIRSNKEFLKQQEKYSKIATDSFETHLRQNIYGDTDNYANNFKKVISDKSKYFLEKFNIKIENLLKNSVKDLDGMYDDGMTENFEKFQSLSDLKAFHLETKDKLITSFKELCDLDDQTKLEPYLKELGDNFDKNYQDNEYLLKMKLEKGKTMDKLLRTEVRRHYSEKMATFLKNNLFIPKNQLKTNHETVLKNTIDKFKSEREEMTEIELSDFIQRTVSDLYTKLDKDNEMRRPTDSIAVGIDLGTTNSCVAIFDAKSRAENNIVVIPNELGHKTTPSVVSFRDNKVLIVGDVAKDDIHAYPKNTISSVKRLIGQSFSSISAVNDFCSYNIVKGKDDLPMISVKRDGKEEKYFAEQISAEVLKNLKQNAEKHLNCKISKAVITVPAYFTDAQREATKQAGKLAELEVLRIINEPTAAAIAFKVDRNHEEEKRKVLIYDFGGGTFDVSLLEINKGEINVLGVDGNNHLGGDDFDQLLIEHCLKKFTAQYEITLTGTDKEVALCRLRSQCEKHKKRLSAVLSTTIIIDNFHDNKDLSIEVTRTEFEELIDHKIIDSIKLVENVLKTAEIKPEDIDDIVLVGGSTRIPKVQQLLSKLFNERPLNHSVNPDEAVAKGAAMQAAILNGQLAGGIDIKLNDVTPLSLGVEVVTKKLSVIIPRNTRIPTKFNRLYYTASDNLTSVEISIYEGENKKLAQANHLLGQFILDGIPAAPAGKEPLDVTFAINEEGILSVKARVVSTGSEEGIQITEHKGRLTPEMIEKLLKESSKK